MNFIEHQFFHLAENNEQCDLWLAQWKLAKKRAPMILDIISHDGEDQYQDHSDLKECPMWEIFTNETFSH